MLKILRTVFSYAPAGFIRAALLGGLSGATFAVVLALANQAIVEVGTPSGLLGLGFLLACLAAFATSALSQIMLVRIAQSIVRELQARVVGEILRTPLRTLERIGQTRLLAALTADIEALSRAAPWIARVLVNGAILVACFVYLGWLSAPLTGLLFAVLVVGGFGYSRLTMRGMRFVRLAHRARDALYGHFRAVLEGKKELKLHQNWRRRFLERLLEDARRFEHARVQASSIFAVTGSWAVTLFLLAIGFTVFVAPEVVTLPGAVRVQFALCILFMLTPLRSLINGMPELAQAGVALARVSELGLRLIPEDLERDGIEAGPASGSSSQGRLRAASPGMRRSARPRDDHLMGEGASSEGRLNPFAGFQTLQLRQASFQFEADDGEAGFVLGPIDLEVKRGEVLFVIGGNGSGKSTLSKLLSGLYPCDQGALLVDGAPVSHVDLESYRSLFSAVFSDYYLFDELLGSHRPSFVQEAQEQLERWELTHKVEVRNDRFSTISLSAGQRKRLALVASLLEDRPICLFDEWAADQDPVFKALFYESVLSELQKRGKTVIAITHDDRYFGAADRCVRLESGRVVSDGRAPGQPQRPIL